LLNLVSVAVPVPYLDLLTYRVPEHLAMPSIGARVRVPIGSRTVTGCVVEHALNGDAPVDGIRDIGEVLDADPFLPPAVVDLCRWVSEYYLSGIGDAIAAAMPPGARHKASSFKTRRVAALTAHGMEVSRAGTEALSAKQAIALEALGGATVPMPLSDLRERGITADVLGRLAARGLVAMTAEADERDPFERAALSTSVPDPARQLTPEQTEAFTQLGA